MSVDPMAESTMTPYQYTYQNPINLIDPTGMMAEGPGDPPKSEEGTAYIYGFNLGNTDPNFKKFMNSLSNSDVHNIRVAIYEQKMKGYDNNISRGIYGTDANGEIAVPESIKEKHWAASLNELYGALKDTWTAQQTGIDPSSTWSQLNPIDQANWKMTRAKAVTTNEEAWGMIGSTAATVAFAYLGGGRLNFKPNPAIFKSNNSIPFSCNTFNCLVAIFYFLLIYKFILFN